jgi:hypothetical protein
MPYKPFIVFVVGLCLIALGVPASHAGININVDYVRKSVVFLYGADAAGNPGAPLGTGFIVQIPLISRPERAYKLLITARHVVEPQWALCPISNPAKMFMRVNKKNFDPEKDSTGTMDIELAGENVAGNTWFVSADPEVDIATMVLQGAKLDAYDVDGAHITDFPTSDELKAFNAGDAIVSAGLLSGASGKKRNYPIFKFGNISSIPEETADASCVPGGPGHPLKIWFIAASLVPGNSGSPLYYVPSGFAGITVGGANNRPVFLGVQSMSFLPWDVAGMVPARYVYETIEKMNLPDADLRRNVQPAKPEAK